jgi:uncharacterized protein (TIGR03085 family)
VTRTNFAQVERAALADLLTELGPDRPTLCEGWTTRDLAAHLVVRDRRPDAAAGIVVKPLAGHNERVRQAATGRPYEDLLALLRKAPVWSVAAIGPLDRAVNTLEFYIHHEDVRRAQPDWQPRALSRAHERALWALIPASARLALRRFPAGVRIEAPGHGQGRAGRGEPVVTVTGPPGELALFLSGRQPAARVEVTGPDELTGKLRQAHLGV